MDSWVNQILRRAHKNFKWPIKIWKFEWDIGHWPILRAHHPFWLGLTLGFAKIDSKRISMKSENQCKTCKREFTLLQTLGSIVTYSISKSQLSKTISSILSSLAPSSL